MDARAMLDRSLTRVGQTVTIVRNVTSGAPIQCTALAFVRGYQPNELTGDIYQDDRKVILSPTGLPFLPHRLDQVVIMGVTCNIEAADAVAVSDGVVRIELQVRG